MSATYYDLLDIPHNATPRMIESAYYSALGLFNDHNLAGYSIFSENEMQSNKNLIEEAYLILSSEEKRKEYNQIKSISNDVDFSLDNNKSGKKENAYVSPLEAKEKFKLNYTLNNEHEIRIEQEVEFSGPFLKSVRIYKKVSLDRMANLTNILKSYLISIEEERFDMLPATAYARGFVFQYSKILKLNPDLVTDAYISRLKQYRNAKLS